MRAAAPAQPQAVETAESSQPLLPEEFSQPLDPADLPYLPYEVDAGMFAYERDIVANKNRNLEVLYRLGLCPADRRPKIGSEQHAHIDVMHGGGDGFEWMVPVAVGDGSPPGHLPHLPPASLIPVRHLLPGHMQLGPPMYGGPCCWTHTGALVLPSAMWGEGDADFLMLHLTGPTCFHRNGAYLPPPTGFHEHGQWVQEVPPPMRKQQQQSYAHQRHLSSELMHNPPLQINTAKCVEGCHMGREGCDRTRAQGFGRTGRV